MVRILLSYILLVFVSSISIAQVMPADGSRLNYRIIGFSVPVHPKAISYRLEIAEGNINNEEYFNKHLIVSKLNKDNKIIATVPQFGKEYTWRVKYLNKKGKVKETSGLYHFSTGYIKRIDTSLHRLQVIDTATGHKDMMVLLDYSRVLYDMNGSPLWYLPAIPGILDEIAYVRDLKITAQGSFTFLSGHNAYEVDYNGNVLWKGPNDGKISGDTSEFYHHEFTRLSNGHYMVLGDETVAKAIPAHLDTCLFENNQMVVRRNDSLFIKILFGTIIEYDTAGNVLWHWRSSDHFANKDLFNADVRNGRMAPSTHLNAFYFDQERQFIYTSFRDLDRIVKIKYPAGEVVGNYGIFQGREEIRGKIRNPEVYKTRKDVWFKGQHCCRISKEGYLYLFNNNSIAARNNFTSHVSIFRENEDNKKGLTKIWDFACDIDTNAEAGTPTGGSVYMLADNSILACVGGAGRTFVVNPQKKVIWNAVSRNWDAERKKWLPFAQYKASMVSEEDLTKLIFRNF